MTDPRCLLRAAAGLATGLVLTGCGLDLGDVPMPATVGGPTYELTAVFDDALNLPEGAPVRLDGDRVGEVTSVEADHYQAIVHLRVSERVGLSRDTHAAIRSSSPMGEAFLELTPGTGAELLSAGDRIPRRRTETAPDVTALLSALSVVTTGGSFADLQVIVTELNTALSGNEETVRRVTARLDTLLTGLNDHTAQIDAVLTGMDRLGVGLARDADVIATSVKTLSPAIRAMAEQRRELVGLLEEVVSLGTVSTAVVERTGDQMVANLESAQEVLATLVALQRQIAPTLRGLTAFSRKLDAAIPADFATFDLRFITSLTVDGTPVIGGLGDGEPLGVDLPGLPGLPDLPPIQIPLPGLPALPSLQLPGLRSS